MAAAYSASPNMGIRSGQVSNGSNLVGVPLLGPRLSAQESWIIADGNRSSCCDDLHSCRHRKHRRRLAVFVFDQAPMERKREPEAGDVDLRDLRRTDHL